MEKSYKELFVDVTQKLPSFAKAILPQFVLYMENCVNYPRNTASLCCVHPKALRGVSTFAETFYGKVSDFQIVNEFTLQVVNETSYDAIYVNYEKGWKEKPVNFYNTDKKIARCVVYKRFSIDVCSDSFLYRKLRDVMIKKFLDAFIEMVREVESLVLSWNVKENARPRFESVTTNVIAPRIPKLWPYENTNNDFSMEGVGIVYASKSNQRINVAATTANTIASVHSLTKLFLGALGSFGFPIKMTLVQYNTLFNSSLDVICVYFVFSISTSVFS